MLQAEVRYAMYYVSTRRRNTTLYEVVSHPVISSKLTAIVSTHHNLGWRRLKFKIETPIYVLSTMQSSFLKWTLQRNDGQAVFIVARLHAARKKHRRWSSMN